MGKRLAQHDAERFADALGAIDRREVPAADRLAAYCDVYRGGLLEGHMCQCGMVAADFDTLAGPTRAAVARLFGEDEASVVGLLEQGRLDGSIALSGSVPGAARTVIAALEGATLGVRPFESAAVFDPVVGRLLADVVPGDVGASRWSRESEG